MENENKVVHKTTFFNTNLKVITGILVFIILAVPGFYYYNFSVLSNSQEKWGQFGDFLGGVLNPIIAIANLCFLIYLTLLIKHRDDQSDEKALETQRLISLNQFRQEAYTQLLKELKNIEKETQTLEEEYQTQKKVSLFLEDFNMYYSYLFEGKEFYKIMLELNIALTDFLIEIDDLNNLNPNANPCDLLMDSDPKHEQFRKLHKTLIESRDELVSRMQRIILNIEDPLNTLI